MMNISQESMNKFNENLEDFKYLFVHDIEDSISKFGLKRTNELIGTCIFPRLRYHLRQEINKYLPRL